MNQSSWRIRPCRPGSGATLTCRCLPATPIRPRSDVEALWSAVADGTVDWVVSDHACCRAEDKFGDPADDVFLAKSGFGGTEFLLSGLITEGLRRGVSHGRIAEYFNISRQRISKLLSRQAANN